MLKRLTPIALAASLTILSTAAHSQDADTVVATVNGQEITLGHMIMVRSGLPEQYLTLPDDVLWKGILDQLVQQTVLAQSGPEAQTKRLKLALENEERALRAAEAVEGIVDEATTEDVIQKAYEAQYASGGGMEFNASHILVETEEKAAEIAEKARGGAEFAGLAREHSTGPSGPNGGELGWFGEGMMVAPFEEAVKGLDVGQISDPVQTQFGWHVIILNEQRAKEAPALEDVREELVGQISNEAVETRIAELTGNAEITRTEATEIDAALIKDTDLVTAQ